MGISRRVPFFRTGAATVLVGVLSLSGIAMGDIPDSVTGQVSLCYKTAPSSTTRRVELRFGSSTRKPIRQRAPATSARR